MDTTPSTSTAAPSNKKPSPKWMKYFLVCVAGLFGLMVIVAIAGPKQQDLKYPMAKTFHRDYFAMRHFVSQALPSTRYTSADWKDSILTIHNNPPGEGNEYTAHVRLSTQGDQTKVIVSSDYNDATLANSVETASLNLISSKESQGQ